MTAPSPVVAHITSKEFLAAAKRESQLSAATSVSVTAYFLVSRSIELALKSYLILRGATTDDLKRIGHDLARASDKAVAAGLTEIVSLSAEGDIAVRSINLYYKSKDLEYLTTGYKSYPALVSLVEYADVLLAGLEPRIRAWRPSA